MNILEAIKKGRLICDGGTGSILQARGLKSDEPAGTWNLTHPDEIVRLHSGYLEAGAQILTCNTFGVNRLNYPAGGPFDLKEVVQAAIRNAREAIRLCGTDPAFIGLDIGPTGKLLEPLGDLSFDEAVDIFSEIIRAGEDRTDLIQIETMNDLYETKAAVLAARECSSLPIFVTLSYESSGRLLTGGSIPATVALLEAMGVNAIGINCGMGPVQMLPLILQFLSLTKLPVILNPNAGLPHDENGKTVYDITAGEFAACMKEAAEEGVRILGGCCGTTPEHIEALCKACGKVRTIPLISSERTGFCLTSGSKLLSVDGNLPEAVLLTLEEGSDIDRLANLASDAEDDDAELLRIHLKTKDAEAAGLLVRAIQSECALPMVFSAGNEPALESALRYYNGKPGVLANENAPAGCRRLAALYGAEFIQ